MPSNKDLIENIQKAAEAKGVEVPETEGKTNAELVKILSGLNADTETKDAAAKDAAKVKEETQAAAKDAAAKDAEIAEANKPPFSVAPGKAVTSKRGIIDSGEEICAEDLAGGEHSLKSLIESGHVIKN